MTRVVVAISVCLLALTATAQPMLPQAPGPHSEGMPPPPVARMYAVHARGAVPEKPEMDDALRPIASVLRDLPFTSYKTIAIHDKEAPWGVETLLPINAVYTMFVTPAALDEEGKITVQAYVEMLQADGSFVKALDATAAAAQNKALLFRGMPLGADELVVVLLISLPSEQQQDSDAAEDAEADETEVDEAQPDPGDEEDAETDEDTFEATPEEIIEEEDDRREEEDLHNESLEALLQSLEEIDRREQKEERNRRDRIDFKGDWW